MTRELLQQALDALKVSAWDHIHAVGKQALIDAIIDRLAQPEPEKRIVWCTETDSACSTCPTLRIPCQAATQAAALNARVTVPREPTQEMIAAGEAVFRSYCFRHVNGAIPTYEAMIAAAPAPAVPTISPLALRALRMADMALASWENGYAFDSHGASREAQRLVTEALAQSAAPAVPLTDADLDRIADAVPVDDIGVHITTWHRRFARAVLSATPAVREPQDERIRWRDAVIKEAESALRTAEQEFADMPTWANVGHAAKKVTHALAVIAALGIGGGGNG